MEEVLETYAEAYDPQQPCCAWTSNRSSLIKETRERSPTKEHGERVDYEYERNGRRSCALGQKPDLFCAAGMGAIDHVRSYFDATGVLTAKASRTAVAASGRWHAGCPVRRKRPRNSSPMPCTWHAAMRRRSVRFLLTKQPA